jgi:hypothetical protein
MKEMKKKGENLKNTEKKISEQKMSMIKKMI